MVATGEKSEVGLADRRAFIEACQSVDAWRVVEGIDWNLELAALTEATAELIPEPPLLLFDNIKGYPAGYRVVSLLIASYKRAALALELPPDRRRLELARLRERRSQERHDNAHV